MNAVTVERKCTSCGNAVALEVPQGGGFAAVAERIARNAKEVLCDRCSEAEERREREEADRLRLETYRRAAGIPKGLAGLSFKALDEDPARNDALYAATAFAAGETRGLYLWGDVGRGKTWLAAAAAEEMMRSGHRVLWKSVIALLIDLDLPFTDKSYAKALGSLRYRPSVLVLDDLDKTPASERAAKPIFAAVESAVTNERPLLITANRDLDELAESFSPRYGEALASRLAGYCRVAEVGGRDRRLDVEAEVVEEAA
jgi:DNA replication protein DnaC